MRSRCPEATRTRAARTLTTECSRTSPGTRAASGWPSTTAQASPRSATTSTRQATTSGASPWRKTRAETGSFWRATGTTASSSSGTRGPRPERRSSQDRGTGPQGPVPRFSAVRRGSDLPGAVTPTEILDQVRGHHLPVASADRLTLGGHPFPEQGVGDQPLDRLVHLSLIEPVRVEAHAVPELVHALRVVVLVPEQRQHDHRLAEVEGLRRGVVPAVRDHEVDERDDVRLGHAPFPPHVVGKVELVRARALRHDVAVGREREHG